MIDPRSLDVMEKLKAHPLFKKVISGVSTAEREHIEETVAAFVSRLAGSLSEVAARPGAKEGLEAIARGEVPTSGSIG